MRPCSKLKLIKSESSHVWYKLQSDSKLVRIIACNMGDDNATSPPQMLLDIRVGP